MEPGGGQGSKDLVPELQPLWFWGKINIVENPYSHSLNDYMPSGLIKGSLAPCKQERDRDGSTPTCPGGKRGLTLTEEGLKDIDDRRCVGQNWCV